jgi:hypothetical protein
MPFWALLLAGGIAFSACSQDAVFSAIQYDKLLNKDPAVPGSPGRIIKLGADPDDAALFTGSNAVYRYKKDAASWNRMPEQPGGTRIMALAGTEDADTGSYYLYALVMQGAKLSESGLYRKKNPHNEDGTWKSVDKAGGSSIQSIHGAGDTLFAGVYDGGGSLWSVTGEGGSLEQVPGNFGILKAAAYYSDTDKYYVAIEGKGLLAAKNPADLGTPAAGPLSYDNSTPNTPTDFVGLIEAGDSLIAVSHSGLIWRIGPGGTVAASKKFDASFNGALALWKDPDSANKTDLLLLGRAVPGGSSITTYYYGYSELPLILADATPTPDIYKDLQAPGLSNTPASTSASNNNSYYNTLGTHPVISLYQAPWGDKVLFATTQQDGLWSCKERDDPKEWNVE